MSRLLSLLAILSLAALAACGGHSASSLTGPAAQFVGITPARAAELPAVKDPGHFSPQRATSQAQVTQHGDQYDDAANYSAGPGNVSLSAPANQLAYAVYRFSGAPGESIAGIDYSGSALSSGGQVWIGVANYDTNHWDFLAPQTGNTASLTVPSSAGTFTSGNGNVYVFVGVFGGDSLQLNSVSVTYPARYSATGQITDGTGAGIPGVTVSSPYANLTTTTDASGNYTLSGFANGTWPIVATKDSWTFYSNPQTVTITDADATGPDFTGRQIGENFLPHDPNGQTDNSPDLASAAFLDNGPVNGTLSAADDNEDCYIFQTSFTGEKYLEFDNPDGDILFPTLNLYTVGGSEPFFVEGSFYVYRGTVCIPLIVTEAPSTFIVVVDCGGGGGHYSLHLGSGPLQSLDIHCQDGAANVIDQVLATVTDNVTTYSTDYFLTGNSHVLDDYRLAQSDTAVLSFPGYSFAPPSTTVDLSSGPQTINFTATPAVYSDSFEPNNSKADADTNGPLTLPYDSTAGPDPLSLDEATDKTDWFKVVPAAGQGLEVQVATAANLPNTNLLGISIVASNGTTNAGFQVQTTNGMMARLAAPADGNPYYVKVMQFYGGYVRQSYTMYIDTYTPHLLAGAVTLGGDPIQGAELTFSNPAHDWTLTQSTTLDGQTRAILARDGEQFHIEAFRYGLNIDRQTQAVTVSADTTVVFAADPAQSQDRLEPNNDLSTVPLQTLPFGTSATLSQETDDIDIYRVHAPDSRPLAFSFTSPNDRYPFDLELDDDAGNIVADLFVPTDGTKVYAATTGAGDYRVLINMLSNADLNYTFSVESADAYHITGNVALNGASPFCTVHCQETGASTTVAASGDYDLGLFPPGTYTVETYISGYTAAPGPTPVTVSNADVTQDFALTAAPSDVGEPNDTIATAYPLTPDGTLTSGYSINQGADSVDYYTFNANQGQLVEIEVSWAQGWWYGPQVNDVYDPALNSFSSGALWTDTSNRCSFVASMTGAYVFAVTGWPADYSLRVTEQ